MYSLISHLSRTLVQKPLQVDNGSLSNVTTHDATADFPVVNDLASLWALLSSLGMVNDWIKLFLLGTVLETIRRFASQIWSSFLESFFLTATFESDDDAYNWMMIWLANQPAWTKARDVHISTKGWGINNWSSIQVAGEDDVRGSLEKRKLNYLPSFGMTQRLWYRGHWMRFTRSRRYLHEGDTLETLTISIFTRDHSVLTRLLLEAKQNYEKEEQHRVSVYVSSIYNDWRRSGSRPKRPMESIILDPGVKDMVLDDSQEFMASEAWYSERGLPYRRGYLFHGCPGSGKTSLVHALAGALGLDIYVINLNKKGLDDSALSQLVSDLPARSIALIEEIDAAFHRGVSREPAPGAQATVVAAGESTGVTLGGLLSSIDGIQASEGRLLFATTNKYHALDPALTRPGRMDVHVEFTYASKPQAEELFKRFFNVTVSDDGALKEKPVAAHSDKVNLPPAPRLTLAQRDELATQFAEAIPDREFAMANLQGLLMNFKSNPIGVIPQVPRWVEKERSARREREKVKKETNEKAKVKDVDGKDVKKEGSDDVPVPVKTNGVNESSDSDSQNG